MAATVDLRTEIREFLTSRRARIAPEMAGLPAHTGTRRVDGLRREEVAVLAGISIEYYVRIERGNLAGTSDRVLDALAVTMQLDDVEREHLERLARRSATSVGRVHSSPPAAVRPALQDMLDAITGAAALIRNGRHDVLAMNHLARALFSPLLTDPRRPANTARFVYLHPDEAARFFVDYGQVAHNCAAVLRTQVGRHPDDVELNLLVNELHTASEAFRQQWASHDVQLHGYGSKRVDHPVVGRLELNFESLDLATDPGVHVNVYTAPAASPTAGKLALLAGDVRP